MDDAARRGTEIAWKYLTPSHALADVCADEIAAALREVEKYLEAEHIMRILLANDSQRHLEAYIQRGKRLARVEAAYRKRCDDYRAVVTILLECDHGDEDMCGCRDRAQEYLGRFSRTPIADALTPDATTEGT